MVHRWHNFLPHYFSVGRCGSSNNTTNSTGSLPSNESKVTIIRGAWGNVWFWEGDFMPPSPAGKISSVVREIHIHRVTTLTDMGVTDLFDPLFSNIPVEFIATTTSDETGFYQINLPPGIYSVFIKEGTKFYANGYDSQGRIKVVEVLPGTVTKLQLDIQQLFKHLWPTNLRTRYGRDCCAS